MQTAVVVLVSGVVGLLGVTSAVLGFIAEAKKLTRDEVYVSGRDCVYPANPAHTLGVCAIFLLAVAEIIASAAGGCCGCCSRPPGGASYSNSTRRRVVGVVASVLSWIAAVIAVAYYWAGAALNAPMKRQAKLAGADEECYLLRGGIFVRAAVLSLVATSLGIISFVLLRPPAAPDAPVLGQPQPAVGLPQWPAQGYGHQEASYPYPAHGYGYGYGYGYGQASDPTKLDPPGAQGQEHPQVYV